MGRVFQSGDGRLAYAHDVRVDFIRPGKPSEPNKARPLMQSCLAVRAEAALTDCALDA